MHYWLVYTFRLARWLSHFRANRPIVAKSPLELQLISLQMFPVQHLLIFPRLGARCLQYALDDLRFGHVRYPWSMYRLTCERRT